MAAPVMTWTSSSCAVHWLLGPLVSMSFRKWVGLPESAREGTVGRRWLSPPLHPPSQRGWRLADAVFCTLVLGGCPPALFLHPLAAGLRCTLGNKVGTEPMGRTGPAGPPPQITDLKGGSRRVIRGNTSLGPQHAPAGSGPQRFWSPSSREGPSRGNPCG